MRFFQTTCAIACLGVLAVTYAEENLKTSLQRILPQVQKYLEQRIREFDQIPDERKSELKKISQYVNRRVRAGEPAKLTFICTHNSRRSHLSQIWAAVAVSHYKLEKIETYSGGTETTAFNPRAIAALERAGLKVESVKGGENPHYAVQFQESADPLICFSKIYHDPPNPQKEFCAVMTCSQADRACPLVVGSSLRVALPFDDPIIADGTSKETARYDERCAQISREMLYLFSEVRRSLTENSPTSDPTTR